MRLQNFKMLKISRRIAACFLFLGLVLSIGGVSAASGADTTANILVTEHANSDAWVIDTQAEWQQNTTKRNGLEIKDGLASPTAQEATLLSVLKTYKTKRAATSIVLDQSPEWLNWEQTDDLGPVNLGDAPVMLSLGPDNYWMFGRYGSGRKKGDKSRLPPWEPQSATLDGFDIPLQTTRFPNQFDGSGGLKQRLGGFHAWQSQDMVNWVHHGPITERASAWMTTAEYANGKAYFYYDFPNDQDPDIMFAEGRFYLATQQKMDFVSPGPWVEDVEVRVGVDTDNDGTIDKWTDWVDVKESYDYIKGFSKQVAKTPARLNLSELPSGYGFQFEIKIKDTTKNESKPNLDRVTLAFEPAAN